MLSSHDQTVLEALKDNEWKTQAQLKTSRQTLNKLVGLGLVQEQVNRGTARYNTVGNKRYRLKAAK